MVANTQGGMSLRAKKGNGTRGNIVGIAVQQGIKDKVTRELGSRMRHMRSGQEIE